MASTKRLSLRAYARHRKAEGLHGTSHTAVMRAIDSGRLGDSATKNARGQWEIDAELADQEWADRSNPVKQRGDSHRGGRPPKDAGGAGPLFGDAELERFDAEAESTAPAPKSDRAQALSMRRAQVVKEVYGARLKQLDYEERSGELCHVAEVRTRQFTVARQVRDAMLQIPDRVAAQVAAMGEELEVRAALEQEISGALSRVIGELTHGAG